MHASRHSHSDTRRAVGKQHVSCASGPVRLKSGRARVHIGFHMTCWVDSADSAYLIEALAHVSADEGDRREVAPYGAAQDAEERISAPQNLLAVWIDVLRRPLCV